jgi:hypothetical protein
VLTVSRGNRLLIAWHEVGAEPAVMLALCGLDGTMPLPPRKIGVGAFPSVASGPGDAALIAFHTPAGIVRVQRVRASSDKGKSIEIRNAAHPCLAAAQEGSFALAWLSLPPAPVVSLARLSADATVVGEARTVGPSDGPPEPVALAAGDTGLAVAWSASPSRHARRLHVAIANPDLSLAAPPAEIRQGQPGAPALVHANGGVFLAYRERTRWASTLRLARIEVQAAS